MVAQVLKILIGKEGAKSIIGKKIKIYYSWAFVFIALIQFNNYWGLFSLRHYAKSYEGLKQKNA